MENLSYFRQMPKQFQINTDNVLDSKIKTAREIWTDKMRNMPKIDRKTLSRIRNSAITEIGISIWYTLKHHRCRLHMSANDTEPTQRWIEGLHLHFYMCCHSCRAFKIRLRYLSEKSFLFVFLKTFGVVQSWIKIKEQ